MVSIVRDQMIAEQTKRADMVRERDTLNRVRNMPTDPTGQKGPTLLAQRSATAQADAITAALGKMPPNAGRAFRRASRERASRVKPSYPLPVVRAVESRHGKGEHARRVRQIAAGVIRVTG